MSKRITVVSTDGHVGGRAEQYRSYMEPAFRDRIDDLLQEDRYHELAMGVHRKRMSVPGLYESDQEQVIEVSANVKARLAELDKEGIAAELLLMGSDNAAPFFFEFNNRYPADLRAAGTRAYHRWLADLTSESGGRLLGNADSGPCLDMKATLAELKWVAEHRFASVALPGIIADSQNPLPPLGDKYYDPFWAACVDLGLVLNVHAGWGMPQGVMTELMKRMAGGFKFSGAEGFDQMKMHEGLMELQEQAGGLMQQEVFDLGMGPRQAMWHLMLGGVFDRFPDLKFVMTEIRADWLPATLAHLDARFAREAPKSLKLKPSEYFKRNCGVTPTSPHKAEIEHRRDIGVDQLMFGADLPHAEGTWPNTPQWIRNAFKGVPETDTRKILGQNAIRIYGFDGARLDAIAARIGPTVEEVFAGEELNERLVKHFDKRAGYMAPIEKVDLGKIDALLDADFAQENAVA